MAQIMGAAALFDVLKQVTADLDKYIFFYTTKA